MTVTAIIPERVVAVEVSQPYHMVLRVRTDGGQVPRQELLDCGYGVVVLAVVVDVEYRAVAF